MSSIRKSTKSRNGCQTCKQKRLKCDEAKPCCGNCKKRGLECPGYHQTLKWVEADQTGATTDSFNYYARPRKRQGAPRRRPETSDSTDVKTETPSYSPVNDFAQELTADGQTAEELGVPNDVFPSQFDTAMNPPIFDHGTNLDDHIDFNDPVHSQFMTGDASGWPFMDQIPNVLEFMSVADLPFANSTPMPAMIEPSSPPGSSSRKRASQELLLRFYQIPQSVPPPLRLEATRLVEHYFSGVCSLYSCFDSQLNPFRTSVSQVWSVSASIYYAIQSMAAAHLGNSIPQMRQAGLEMHAKASKSLKQELQSLQLSDSKQTDRVLLSLLLVGLTACWQSAGDLGLPYFRAARSLIYPRLAEDQSGKSEEERRRNQFFEEAMIYWEMLMSFVSHDIDLNTLYLEDDMDSLGRDDAPLDSFENLNKTNDAVAKIIPHPWTGVNPQTQVLLAEVGRLIRKVRLTKYPNYFGQAESKFLRIARRLEEDLLAVNLPSPQNLVDPGDPYTEKQHFITVAEATRCAALLELYRVFPPLLRRRLGCSNKTALTPSDANMYIWSSSLPTPIPDVSTDSDPEAQLWLVSLGIHILDLVETLPMTSGIRPQQLLLILIGGAELKFPPADATMSDVNEISDLELQIGHARAFSQARLGQLADLLPNQPVHRVIEVVSEVWSRFDSMFPGQQADIFWLDIMVEKGWHTMIG